MAPKKAPKAEAADDATAKAAAAAKAKAAAAAAKAEAELVKECDRALASVASNPKTAAAKIAKLVKEKGGCSLTLRMQIWQHVVAAELERAAAKKHLQLAVSAAKQAVASEGGKPCALLQCAVMLANMRYAQCCSLTAADQLGQDKEPSEAVLALIEESRAPWDAAYTAGEAAVSALKAASALPSELLLPEKRLFARTEQLPSPDETKAAVLDTLSK